MKSWFSAIKRTSIFPYNIRFKILQQTGKKVAVIVSDTFVRPFRMGQTDHATGVSGIDTILHY